MPLIVQDRPRGPLAEVTRVSPNPAERDTLGYMSSSHDDPSCAVAHGHDDASGAVAHGHDDPSCEVAHGTAPIPAVAGRVLVAVFASPVAGFLMRYARDAGYQTVLVEPDAERAKALLDVAADVRDSVASEPDGPADVVVTDHHRPELGLVLRDALGTDARWIGVMGNPRVAPPHISALTELGVAPDEIRRVHRPVGLNIGSRAPAEIAIATLAGLIADRNDRPGGFDF
jgi:xanthine dehydrogenase accessory factor